MKGKLLIAINLLVFLGAAHWIIAARQEHLHHGTTIYLDVAQYDPRSLMQGDYMNLSYPICTAIETMLQPEARGSGQAVIHIDGDQIGRFRRLHTEKPIAADEHLLAYRIRRGRNGRIRVAAESYFFQEGHGAAFAAARYAELSITEAGQALLVALCDADRERIASVGLERK